MSSKLGLLQYFLLRNDKVWKRLSEAEKTSILEANQESNAARYAHPEEYGAGRVPGGEVFDSSLDRLSTMRGKVIQKVLEAHAPSVILEIGPGSGFYTRQICEHKSVSVYTAIDIVPAFLEYLSPRLEEMVEKGVLNRFSLVHDDFMRAELGLADLIILISSVHHIPNRVELFSRLCDFLVEGGHIVCLEPTHYLSRIMHLCYRFATRYHKKSYWSDRRNLSTHAFCTYEEFSEIIAQIETLEIEELFFEISTKARVLRDFVARVDPESFMVTDRNVLIRPSWLRWFAFQMGIVFRKRAVR